MTALTVVGYISVVFPPAYGGRKITCQFSVILHRNSLKDTSISASFLYNLTKNFLRYPHTIVMRCCLYRNLV